MGAITDRCLAMLRRMKEGPASYPTVINVGASQVLDTFTPPTLARNESYFAVRLNQLRLASGRKWWVQIAPMAFMVAEFQHGRERLAVPFVVGPSMLERFGQPVPGGMLFDDTVIVGLHPYKGGRIAITAILYEVPRSDEARRLLSFVEKAASVVGAATAMGTYLKVADVVLDGLEGLLGLDGVRPVAGRRFEVDPDLADDLGTGWFVLADGDLKPENVWVKDHRLQYKHADGGGFYDVPDVDLLLYSLVSAPRRTDIEQLDFHPTIREAETQAHADASDDGWKRAKAIMTTAFTQIIDSADLTMRQGDELRAEWRKRLVTLHEEALANAHMGPGDDDVERARAFADATSILDL